MRHRANRNVRGRHRRTTPLHSHRAPSTPVGEKGRHVVAAALVAGVGVAGVTTATSGAASGPAAGKDRPAAAQAELAPSAASPSAASAAPSLSPSAASPSPSLAPSLPGSAARASVGSEGTGTGSTGSVGPGSTSSPETSPAGPLETGSASPLGTGSAGPLGTASPSPLETGTASALGTGSVGSPETGSVGTGFVESLRIGSVGTGFGSLRIGSVDAELSFVPQARKVKPLPLWVHPLPEAATTSCFGPRWGRLHAGVDLAAPDGTRIRAAGGGTVVAAGPAEGYGNAVLIDHGNGYLTHYGHLSAITVTPGQHVAVADQVGNEGSTGHSTGPHLHFEVHQGSYQNPIEPTAWMNERGVDITGCASLSVPTDR